MNFQYIQPKGILSQFIKYYWVLEASASEGDICERVIPVENIELMFHYKNPFVVARLNNSQSTQPLSMISGLKNTFDDVSTQGESGVIAVTFYPYGACQFFNFPLFEIEGLSLHLEKLFNHKVRFIEEKICAAKSLSQRVEIIEQFLLKKYDPIAFYDYSLIKNTVTLIKELKGQINVSELSKKLSINAKKLERKFAAYVGKTPKQYIKIIRFQETVLHLSQNKNPLLIDYAFSNGYYDQSHFINDFKTFSGYTPKEFLVKCPCGQIEYDSKL